MGRRIVRWGPGVAASALTPTATADTTNLANQTYPGVLQGGSSTQINRVWEIAINGQAVSSSSPTPMTLARDSTVGAINGTINNTDTVTDSSGVLSAANTLNAWATPPQRSATLRLLSCALNAFGGSFFWRANRIEECMAIVGQAANTGEMSLSCGPGGTPGLIDSHYEYETA